MNFLRASVFISLFISGCTGPYYLKDTRVSQTRINQDSLGMADTAVLRIIAPYKQKLDAQMGEVIVSADVDLIKEKPEGNLNDLVADAVLAYASKNSDRPVDFCILNYGGIRVSSIAKGNITLGKIYEVMPFDNLVELVEVDGKSCRELLDLAAKNGGWPVSGLRMRITGGRAAEVSVRNNAFDESKSYFIATSDYMANGGDNASMLQRASKRTPLNYKVRDAIIDYLRDQKSNNQNIKIQKDGRVSVQP